MISNNDLSSVREDTIEVGFRKMIFSKFLNN